jgi:hypothetical protein
MTSLSRLEEEGIVMCQEWSESLWRFSRAPRNTESRARQVEVIAAIRDLLDPVRSTATLAAHYRADTSVSLARSVAETLHPDDPALRDQRRTRDVAYGLRYVELLTGANLDPTLGLPYWLGEWAVY